MQDRNEGGGIRNKQKKGMFYSNFTQPCTNHLMTRKLKPPTICESARTTNLYISIGACLLIFLFYDMESSGILNFSPRETIYRIRIAFASLLHVHLLRHPAQLPFH
jgi:hypothetical protein